jgi:hypothetical protein
MASAEFEELREELEDLGLGDIRVPFDIWVGDDGLVRKHSITLNFADLGLPEDVPASMSMVLEYFGYGDAVRVEEPAAANVTDMTKMFLSMGGFTR